MRTLTRIAARRENTRWRVRGARAFAAGLAAVACTAVIATAAPVAAGAAHTAGLGWGGGWHEWWSAHGKDVATVAGCFLDGVVAARWLALGGTAMALAGLAAAAVACFS